jgi:hypothetical protein
MHEAKNHEQNCVVTLTYDDDHLPEYKTIVPDHAVDFMQRLRDRLRYEKYKNNDCNTSRPIKTYGCAEYGEKYGRPHYHIILFGHDFTDKKCVRNALPKSTNEEAGKGGYYTSDILDTIWGHGQCQTMDLTFDSAAYVARYVMKKMTGQKAEHYQNRLPEQAICISQKGIGKDWYKKNKHKIYTNDIIHINGKQIKPTKYYDKQYEIEHIEKYKQIKEKRNEETNKYLDKIKQQIINGDNTNNFSRRDRQQAHERCMEAKAAMLKRTVE